jgi:hypothetical protein
MKQAFTLLLLVTLPGLVSAQPKQNPQSIPLVFTHVTVIDATGAPAKPDMTLVVVGDRITELGPTKKVRVPKNAQVVDATGKFLIPGLWDMHVHLFSRSSSPSYNGIKYIFPLSLANGVTGLRVMSTKLEDLKENAQWRVDMAQSNLLGPRIRTASMVLEGAHPAWSDTVGIADEAQGRALVRAYKNAGANRSRSTQPFREACILRSSTRRADCAFP